MKSVGIDIGSSSIKIVEAQSSAKGLVVSRFIEKNLSPIPGTDPEIEILEFLRQVSQQYDPDSARFVIGVRQDRVAVRHKTFPFTDRTKILKSLPFELEEELPFSSDNSIFDARMVRYVGPSAEVLACATPKNRVTEAIQRMNDGLMPAAVVTAEGIAFANNWEKWSEAPPSVAAITSAPTPTAEAEAGLAETTLATPSRNIHLVAHIGHQRTIVAAFDGSSLISVRSISWGGKFVAEAIARKYEMEYVQALKELQSKSFILLTKEGASYDQIVFSDIILDVVKELSRDLKITFLDLKSEFNANITALSLTGGGSRILNLHAVLTQSLELPVNHVQVLTNTSVQGFEVTPYIDSVIAPALGLAIEGLRKPRHPALNFLKGELAPKNLKFEKMWTTWGKTLQIAAAGFVLFSVYALVRDQVASSLSEKSSDTLAAQAKAVAGLPSKAANETGVKKYIKEQKDKTSSLAALESIGHMNSALDFLKKLSEAAPARGQSNLVLARFSISDQILEIEGSSTQTQDIAAVGKLLQQMSVDGVVQTKTPSAKTVSAGTAFAYSVKVDRGFKATSGESEKAAKKTKQ